MAKIRTTEELEEYFKQLKEKRERKEQRQKTNEERKQQLEQYKLLKQQEKNNRRLENSLYEQQRTILIYHTRYIQKYTDDEETYTKYELQNIDKLYPKETGRLNWDFFYHLVEETKNSFIS